MPSKYTGMPFINGWDRLPGVPDETYLWEKGAQRLRLKKEDDNNWHLSLLLDSVIVEKGGDFGDEFEAVRASKTFREKH